jgi:Na+-driven multidrug efflux pump
MSRQESTESLSLLSTVGRGLRIGGSYSFSAQVFAVMMMAQKLKGDPNYPAAAGLVATTMNIGGMVTSMVLFGVSMEAPQACGILLDELKKPEAPQQSENVYEDEDKPLLDVTSDLEAGNQIQYRSPKVINDCYDKLAAALRANLKIACGVALVGGGFFAASPYLLRYAFRQSEEVSNLAGTFLQPYAPAMLAVPLRFASELMILPAGFETYALAAVLFTFSSTTVAAHFASLGYMGESLSNFPGIATWFAIEPALTAAAFIAALRFSKTLGPISWLQKKLPTEVTAGMFLRMLKAGLMFSLTSLNEVAVGYVAILVAGLISAESQTAFSYALLPTMLTFIPIAGIASAAMQSTGRKIGQISKEGDPEARASEIKKLAFYMKAVVLTTAITLLPLALPLMIAPETVLKVIGCEDSALEHSARIARWTGPYVLAEAVRVAVKFQLMLVGDINIPTALTCGALWLAMIVGSLLAALTPLGDTALIVSLVVGVVLADGLLLPRLISKSSTTKLNGFIGRPIPAPVPVPVVVPIANAESPAIIELSDEADLNAVSFS